MVLIGGYGDEGSLVEDVSTVGRVLGSERIIFICFDYVESWLVLVHGVQDDLEKKVREGNSRHLKYAAATTVTSHFTARQKSCWRDESVVQFPFLTQNRKKENITS